MARVKTAIITRKKHKKILKRAKGSWALIPDDRIEFKDHFFRGGLLKVNHS